MHLIEWTDLFQYVCCCEQIILPAQENDSFLRGIRIFQFVLFFPNGKTRLKVAIYISIFVCSIMYKIKSLATRALFLFATVLYLSSFFSPKSIIPFITIASTLRQN